MIDATLLAVFLAGLLGGVHCAGMCGGIVGALSLAQSAPSSAAVAVVSFKGGSALARPTVRAGDAALARLLSYNAGRIVTYTSLGAVAGAVGSLSAWLSVAYPLQQLSFALTNAVLIFMGCYVAGLRWPVQWVERLGGPVWRRVQPLAVRQLQRAGLAHAALTGAVWGMVPCGLVYAVLVAAVARGNAADGALLMAAFGAGTLPNLVLLGASAGWLQRQRRRPGLRRVLGTVIAAFGLLGLLRLDAAQQLPLLRHLCAGLGL